MSAQFDNDKCETGVGVGESVIWRYSTGYRRFSGRRRMNIRMYALTRMLLSTAEAFVTPNLCRKRFLSAFH